MGTTVQSLLASRSTQDHHPLPQLQWLTLVLRRRRLTPSTSPSMSMTSREMARLMPSTLLTKDDVFPMYKACKDSKDQGGFHDFVEILKLYDKNDDNTMLAHEL